MMLRLCLLLLFFTPLIAQAASINQNVTTATSAIATTSAIESPSQFLGYPLGSWHLRHDQINFYLKQLARQSPRVSLESTGSSHEARSQLTAVITSAANQANLKQIMAQRAQVKSGQPQTGPLVIWLAYSIHGDEASGAHAALTVSHQLSSSQEPWVIDLLDNAVVLITPTQNPDGLDRFSTWANNYTGKVNNSDGNHNEHQQNWPSGRSNHYFADLNRDWLFLRHPETRARIALFHRWHPHYVGDFHEMGHNQSYFFQPGVPKRTHPLTPEENQRLTHQLAAYHAKALDTRQQPYFSQQMFDDFYYGKGSTYPDINGSVGMLFEQASVRGQQQESDNGMLVFEQAIANQVATSFSSLKGALALKQELQLFQTRFYQRKDKHQPSGRESGLLISTSQDPGRRDDLAQVLQQHQILFFYLREGLRQGRHYYAPRDSLFIPINQPQKSLLLALFDQRTEFDDATFYDVSSWNFTYAYNLQLARDVSLDVDTLSSQRPLDAPLSIAADSVAVLIDWRQHHAATVLQQLLSHGVKVKFAAKPFSIMTSAGASDFTAGTLQIPLGRQTMASAPLRELLISLATHHRLTMATVTSSRALSGIDLGSPDFHPIAPIKAVVITGYGTSASEVGELGYFMDQHLAAPLTQVDVSRLPSLPLNRYTHLFLADGSYQNVAEKLARKLGQFVNNGGVIVAQKGALSWLSKGNLLKSDVRNPRAFEQLFATDGMRFDEQATLRARKAIGGAILALDLDTSHPINFGLQGNILPILKNKPLGLLAGSSSFTTAASYADEPLLDGYLATEYQRSFSQTPAIRVERHGQGAIVALTDNLLFRNSWLDAQKVYSNSLYFIPALH